MSSPVGSGTESIGRAEPVVRIAEDMNPEEGEGEEDLTTTTMIGAIEEAVEVSAL